MMMKKAYFWNSGAVPAFVGTARLGGKILPGKGDRKATSEDKYRGWSLNASYECPLSKRTFGYDYAS